MHLPALLEAAADHRFIPSTKRLLTLLSHLPAYACNAELKISLIARVSKAQENNGSQQIADKKCVFEVDEYTHIHQTRMSKALNHLLTTYGTPAFTKIIKEEIDKNNIEENARIVENAEAVIRDQSK